MCKILVTGPLLKAYMLHLYSVCCVNKGGENLNIVVTKSRKRNHHSKKGINESITYFL